MSKTIKQIADEIGVSKQAIHQKRRKEPLSTNLQPFTSTVDGVIYISNDGEKLIKQSFSKGEPSTFVDGIADNKFMPIDGEIPRDFSAVIDVMKRQLEVKDKQIAEQQQSIKELTAALENTTSSLKAAQALHAGTMQKNFESLPPSVEPPERQAQPTAEPEHKEGFFSRFFKR